MNMLPNKLGLVRASTEGVGLHPSLDLIPQEPANPPEQDGRNRGHIV